MKRPLIIVGAGGHARPVVDAAKLIDNWQIEGIVDIGYKQSKNEKILDCPVIGGLSAIDNIKTQGIYSFVALGNNETRMQISRLLYSRGFLPINIIHPLANIALNAHIGSGNYVGPFANVGPGVVLGNHCIVNTHANLEHEVISEDYTQFGPASIVCGRSKVGQRVFLGAGSIVIENLSIAAGSVIGAGAVVVKDIKEENLVYTGVPARKKS